MPEPGEKAANFGAVRIYATEKISEDRYYAYTWVLEETYSNQNGELHRQSSSAFPYRFELSNENSASGVVAAELIDKANTPKKLFDQMYIAQHDGTIQDLEDKITEQAKGYFEAVLTE